MCVCVCVCDKVAVQACPTVCAHSQVVIDAYDVSILRSSPVTKLFDLATCPPESLHEIDIPFDEEVRGAWLCAHD